MDTKICRTCKQEKPIYKFEPGENGYHKPDCYSCRTIKRKRNPNYAKAATAWSRAHPNYAKQKGAEYGQKHDRGDLVPPDTYQCAMCKKEFTSDNFYHNRAKKIGIDSYCIPCRRSITAARARGRKPRAT